MVNPQKAGLCFPVFILFFIFSSCMLMKEAPSPKVKSAPPPQASVQTPEHDRHPSTSGHPNQVIDSYKTEIDKTPKNEDVIRNFAKKLEAMNNAAERSYGRHDYASAGKTYYLLLKRYPDYKDAAHLLSFNKTQLNTRLTNCKTALYQKGFQEYRKGHLSRAIATWQDYLEIDPDNADIKRALSTAKAQQKNLRHAK